MFVLHAVCLPDDQVAVWAEDSARSVTSGTQAVRQARPHPFAASADQLAALLRDIGHVGPSIATVVHLPSLRRAPLDSPEVVRLAPRPVGRGAPSLLPWTVPAVVINPADAGAILDDCGEHDARPGASLHFLASLADVASDLTGRGRVVPTIVWADEVHARWRAAPVGADAVAAHAVISAMPPSFRAAAAEAAPERLAVVVLDAVVDASCRRILPSSFLPLRRGRKPAVTPAAEAWLQALAGPDSVIHASEDEIDALQDELSAWDGFGRGDPGPAGLVLRLRAPQAEGVESREGGQEREASDWAVEFLLRSRADPSLLVDAAAVWTGGAGLERWLNSPRETLLTELARAQRVYPELERGLRQSDPGALLLDTDGAHRFLTDAVPALDEAGFEVQVPGWWSRRRRIGLKLHATPSDAGELVPAFGREELADFRWEMALGDHGLTAGEIEALAAAKASIVRLRGEWVAVDQDRLARGLRFLREQGSGRMPVREVIDLALSHPDDTDLPLEMTDVAADGWLGELISGTASVADVAPPAEFRAVLRPYQQRGLGWLDFLGRLGLGGVLADDMGLGKTVQLLAWEATARERQGQAHRPTLLLCPTSLVGNWQAESARFAPTLRTEIHYGRERAQGAALQERFAEADLVITTYGTVLRDADDLAEIAFERVVLDEAQLVKNRLSRTAKAVRRLRAGQRIALTGTPVENRLSELWSIMDAVNPGMLGESEAFRERFARPIERDGDPDAAALLRRITRPYILRRVKTDPAIIDDLPAKIEVDERYRLTVEQASLYQTVVDDMMARIEDSDGIARRGNVLAAMTKLKQVCNHPALLLHEGSTGSASGGSVLDGRSGKLVRFEQILGEILDEGDRVLCFTQYTEFAEMLVPHLAARFDTDVAYLSGSTPQARRTDLVKRFQSGTGPSVFVLSLKAGGTGLNLTAANHVVHLDRWWNPAVENQATDRAFRIGQKRSVQVRKFIGIGTMEERIDEMIQQKKALADLVVGDGEGWLTELSTDRLRELFTLSKDAAGE